MVWSISRCHTVSSNLLSHFKVDYKFELRPHCKLEWHNLIKALKKKICSVLYNIQKYITCLVDYWGARHNSENNKQKNNPWQVCTYLLIVVYTCMYRGRTFRRWSFLCSRVTALWSGVQAVWILSSCSCSLSTCVSWGLLQEPSTFSDFNSTETVNSPEALSSPVSLLILSPLKVCSWRG